MMFCTNCGNEIADAAVVCPKCGVAVAGTKMPASSSGPTVPSHMVGAIVSLLFCWPVGIPAIVFACKVNSKLKAGDITGAEKASKTAKILMIVGILGGILAVICRISTMK